MPDENPTGVVATVTGSTNTPETDGVTRGSLGAVVGAVIAIALYFLNAPEVVALSMIPINSFLGNIAWGMWDTFVKPRLPSA